MAIVFEDKDTKMIGSWQELFVPSCSARITHYARMLSVHRKFAWNGRVLRCGFTNNIKNEPRIIQRALFLEAYLKEKVRFHTGR